MSRLNAITAFFKRFAHPWLVAVAAAGGIWLVMSFPVGVLGQHVHPAFTPMSVVLHLLGVSVVILSGIVFGVLWWADYVNEMFFST